MRHYFKVRSYPNQIDLYPTFLERNIVAIGYPKITVNDSLSNVDIIKSVQQQLHQFYGYTGQPLNLRVGYFKKMLSMKIGDIILLPHENKEVAIVQVTSEYHFEEKDRDNHMSNQVGIKLLKVIPTSILSERLKRSVDVMLSISSLDNHSEEINRLITSDINNSTDNSKNKIDNTVQLHNNSYLFEQNINQKKLKIEIDSSVTPEELTEFFSKVEKLISD